jgi:hypothetical protein
MGVTKQAYTVRLCEETAGMLRKIQAAFSPFCEDLSSTVRFVIRLAYALIFDAHTLLDVFDLMQQLRCKTLHYRPQMSLRFPGALEMRPKIWRQQ